MSQHLPFHVSRWGAHAFNAHTKLHGREFLVLDVLLGHADANLRAFPGYATIARLTGIERSKVGGIIHSLEKKGALKVEKVGRLVKGGSPESSRYLLFPGVDIEALIREIAPPRSTEPRPRDGDMSRPHDGDTLSPSRRDRVPMVASPRPREGDLTLENSRELPLPNTSDVRDTPAPAAGGEGDFPLWFLKRIRAAEVGADLTDEARLFEAEGGTEDDLEGLIEAAGKPGLLVHWLRGGREVWQTKLPTRPEPRSIDGVRIEHRLVEHGFESGSISELADGFALQGGTPGQIDQLVDELNHHGFQMRDLATWIRSERTWRGVLADAQPSATDSKRWAGTAGLPTGPSEASAAH